MNNIFNYAKLFAAGYAFFILLDVIFLGYVMRGLYQKEIGAIARTHNNQMKILIAPGLLVWALIVVGAIIFVLPRCLGAPLYKSFLWGALYGLIVYGVYDFTNYAVLEKWSLLIALVDLLWGMLANGLLVVVLSRMSN